MIPSLRKGVPGIAVLLLALCLRLYLPESARHFPVRHHRSPAVTSEQASRSEATPRDFSPVLPEHSIYAGGLRLSHGSLVSLTEDLLPFLGSALSSRAPPA